MICQDKATFDKTNAIKQLNKWLKEDFAAFNVELHYGKIQSRRIIAEEFLGDKLIDYKFFCFDGEPKAMFIATDRGREDVETKFDFFDMQFNHLPFTNGHPNSDKPIKKPEKFDLMIELAKKLSQDMN